MRLRNFIRKKGVTFLSSRMLFVLSTALAAKIRDSARFCASVDEFQYKNEYDKELELKDN